MRIKHQGDHRARRAADYPSLAEQLDALWHAMDRNELPRVAGFYDAIAAVKTKYPKPKGKP